MESHRLFGSLDNAREYAKEAIVAATFGYHCGPTRADDCSRLRTAKFTAIFLYLDDTTHPQVMSADRWAAFHASLIALLRGAGQGAEHSALLDWLAELRRVGAGAPDALADFDDSFLDYCLSLDDERRATPAAMSAQEFLDLRRRTIFVEPVLNQWRVSMGINVPPSDPFRPLLMAAQGMARDLVIFANDLGSLARDSTAEATEKNLILHDALRGDGQLGPAAERAIAAYNALVERLEQKLAEGRTAGAPFCAALADVLQGLVNGNLDSMAILEARYARSEPYLRRLRYVDT